MPAVSRLLVSLAASASALDVSRTTVNVSPVQKVIELLKNLQAETEEQGKKEAAQYDKFACFCKEQADEKLYAIEKSTKKQGNLNEQIDELNGEINELNEEIKKLQREIEEQTASIDAAAADRAKEHEAYKVEDADISSAIGAMKGAIKALKDSKSAQEGNAKVDFAQIRAVAGQVLAAVGRVNSMAPSQSQIKKVTALAQIGSAQAPPSYEYRSNDIISTLEDLLDIFLKNKKDADVAEFEARAAWEKKDLNMKNIRNFAEKDKAEQEKVAEDKSSEKSAAEEELDEETNDKTADEAFLKVVTEECEAKAAAWDQRVKCRADELKAMSGAMEALTEKVAPSAKANKKLAQLQIAAAGKPASFLQLRRSEVTSKSVVQKASKLLLDAAKQIGSSPLTLLAVRVDASKDHFVKVRGLIRDLLTRMEEDAKAEAEQKGFCDKAMSKNLASRDKASAEIESLTAEKARDTAEMKKLMQEVADLSSAIADLNAALKEATDLRNQESEENKNTVATAEEGKAGTELALKLLKDFYAAAGGSLVQYVPPNSDREGKTFGDRAPDIFDNSGYNGQQTGSKGIVGMLEVILSDFDRTIDTTNTNEADAQAEFEMFEEDTKNDVAAKRKSKDQKEDRITEIKDELTAGEDSLKEQNQLLETAEATLQELKTQCVDGEETYAERVAKREKEIESLKEALNILIEWQGF